MSKSATDMWTILGILFIFGFSMFIILDFSTILSNKDAEGDLDLTNDTLLYIAAINLNPNFNLTDYQSNKAEQEDPVVFKTNSSEGNPKDFAIEYLEGKERASGYTNTLKRLYDMPTTILLLIGFPESDFKNAISGVFWLLGFVIALSLYWFFRGVKG